MDAIEKAKDIGTDGLEFLAGLGGLLLGQAVVMLVPKTKIAIVDKILPGAINVIGAGITATQFRSNGYVKHAAFGMGMSGVASLVKNFTAGSAKGSIAEKVNKSVTLPTPSLKGMGEGETIDLLSGTGDFEQQPVTMLSNTPSDLLFAA
jgi:hypothetical protein